MPEKALVRKQDFIDATLLLRQYANLLASTGSLNPDQASARRIADIFEAQLLHPTRIG